MSTGEKLLGKMAANTTPNESQAIETVATVSAENERLLSSSPEVQVVSTGKKHLGKMTASTTLTLRQAKIMVGNNNISKKELAIQSKLLQEASLKRTAVNNKEGCAVKNPYIQRPKGYIAAIQGPGSNKKSSNKRSSILASSNIFMKSPEQQMKEQLLMPDANSKEALVTQSPAINNNQKDKGMEYLRHLTHNDNAKNECLKSIAKTQDATAERAERAERAESSSSEGGYIYGSDDSEEAKFTGAKRKVILAIQNGVQQKRRVATRSDKESDNAAKYNRTRQQSLLKNMIGELSRQDDKFDEEVFKRRALMLGMGVDEEMSSSEEEVEEYDDNNEMNKYIHDAASESSKNGDESSASGDNFIVYKRASGTGLELVDTSDSLSSDSDTEHSRCVKNYK